MSYIIYNDQILENETVKINIEDRGYNFGDGIYEVVPIHQGKFFGLTEHLNRFEASAEKLEIQMPYSRTILENLLHQLKETSQTKDGMLYFQMTRGVSPRSHLYERNVLGLLTGFCRSLPSTIEQQENGVDVYVTEDIRWLRCDIKSINLLGNSMAKRLANDHSCHEAILHRDEIVTEGSSSNLFIVKDQTIYTHPATNLILNGITRQFVIEIAILNQLAVKEVAFTLEDLLHADEAFITSSLQDITPIVNVHGNISCQFPIGPVTKKLQQLFQQYVNEALAK